MRGRVRKVGRVGGRSVVGWRGVEGKGEGREGEGEGREGRIGQWAREGVRRW